MWRLVATLNAERVDGSKTRGHRLFLDTTVPDGGIALADDSGGVPDRTNDGVLWLDCRRHIEVSRVHIRFPLLSARTGARVWTVDQTNEHNMRVLGELSLLPFAEAKDWLGSLAIKQALADSHNWLPNSAEVSKHD